MALTENMKAFARAKVQGKSNKEAALAAGYSEKSAGSKGSQLAKDPDVIAYLDGLVKSGGEGAVLQSMPLGEAALQAEVREMENIDALQYLRTLYKDPLLDRKVRMEAARIALPYEHGKVGEMGVKEGRDAAANEAAKKGKFATADEQRSRRVS